MLCGVAIVIYGMQCGLVDEEVLLIVILALFGGEQLLKAWVKQNIDAGTTNRIPPILLLWYRATETEAITNGIVVQGT
jgi:hypothetical protein